MSSLSTLKRKRKVRNILILISFISATAFGQIKNDVKDQWLLELTPVSKKFLNLNYRSQIDQAGLYFIDDKQNHSSVKPLMRFTKDYDNGMFLKLRKKTDNLKVNRTRLYPLSDLTGGVQLSNSSKAILNAGLGVGFDHSSTKFLFTAKFLPYYAQGGALADSSRTIHNQDFGSSRSMTNNMFYRAEVVAAYQANKFFTFSGGYGKNWFGEGYRSLLLSDNAAAHPFAKIETSFAGIKYVNLYNAWKDNTNNPYDTSQDINKFSSIHYLSWNITRELNLSIFETVVWQGKDTLTNRGFDVNYLNPIVFYRPVEYGLGSSDNVLLGANLSYKFDIKHNVYAQFVLDEFLLSEIQAKSKWWANKYGYQLGYKTANLLVDNLYFQIEFNGVRPFTYSHKSSQHAYGHLNSSVTHPVGANFYELLNVVSYKKDKHRFTNKMNFISYGVDSSATTSVGQDIFKSYTLRDGNYDHLIMQGQRLQVFNESFVYEYALWPEIEMYLLAKYDWRAVNTSQGLNHFHTFSVGIKSRIWNSYNDF
jgi:hypothetical protein